MALHVERWFRFSIFRSKKVHWNNLSNKNTKNYLWWQAKFYPPRQAAAPQRLVYCGSRSTWDTFYPSCTAARELRLVYCGCRSRHWYAAIWILLYGPKLSIFLLTGCDDVWIARMFGHVDRAGTLSRDQRGSRILDSFKVKSWTVFSLKFYFLTKWNDAA